jgi:hypothetical protein
MGSLFPTDCFANSLSFAARASCLESVFRGGAFVSASHAIQFGISSPDLQQMDLGAWHTIPFPVISQNSTAIA